MPDQRTPFPKEGLVATHDSGRRLGVWLMPDNESLGMLETFVKDLIPAGDRLLTRAQSVVDAIPAEDRRFAHKVDAACIHTWLAWQQDPGERMGSAINRKYLDPKSPAAVFLDHGVAIAQRHAINHNSLDATPIQRRTLPLPTSKNNWADPESPNEPIRLGERLATADLVSPHSTS